MEGCRYASGLSLVIGHRVRVGFVLDRGSKSHCATAQTIRLAADGREVERIVGAAANAIVRVVCSACSDLLITGFLRGDSLWRRGGVVVGAIKPDSRTACAVVARWA